MEPFVVEEFWNGLRFLATIPILPYLHIVHSLYTARKIRRTPGGLEYNRKYPLAGLVGFAAVNFGSTIMMSFFFGEKWSFLSDNFQVPSAILCWYLVFFSPLDAVFIFLDVLPIQVYLFAFAAVEGVRNGLKNAIGVREGLQEFPDSLTSAILAGFLNACGSSFLFWFERQARGSAALNELAKPSGFAKLALICPVFYILVVGPTESFAPAVLPKALWLSHDLATGMIVVVHVLFQTGTVINKYFDPLYPIFWVLRLLFFGATTVADDEHHHSHVHHPKPTAEDLEVKGPEPTKTLKAAGSATKAGETSPSILSSPKHSKKTN